MIKIQIPFILFCLILFSCNKKSNTNKVEYIEFAKDVPTRQLYNDTTIKLPELLDPRVFALKDSILAISVKKDSFSLYLFKYPEMKLLGAAGKKGKGPGELFSIYTLQFYPSIKELWVYDIVLRRYTCFQTDSIIKNVNYRPDKYIDLSNSFANEKGFIRKVYWVNDSTIAGAGMNSNSRVAFFNNKGKLISTIGKIENENSEQMPKSALADLHSSEVHLIPNVQFVLADRLLDQIEIFGLNDSSTIIVRGPEFKKNKYRINEVGNLCYLPKTWFSYVWVHMSNKAIYALYSGKTMNSLEDGYWYGNIIYKFDLKGNVKEKLILDGYLQTFIVDEDRRIIYGTEKLPVDKLVAYRF